MAGKKRILIINTFPITRAQTGGQKRQEAIVRAYQETFEKVQYVGVFFKEHYKHFSPDDIPLPDELTAAAHDSPYTTDMLAGNAIFENVAVKQKMTEIIQRVQPDIIQVEQVFPYFGLKRLLQELGLHPKLVYSSHNIEYRQKQDILQMAHAPKDFIAETVQAIKDLELELTKNADLVVACTEHDRAFYEKHGAKKAVLARNGMAAIQTTQTALAKWQKYFTDRGVNKKVLFVGSAHPPNWTGFIDMVSLGVGFMPFDARILLVGGVCDYFRDHINEAYNPQHLTFWQRVIELGRPDDADLGALITLADAIILPITEGGGSNLKTAEAVLADKPVVATTHAFRSFEELKTLPDIYLSDDPAQFRANIVKALSTLPTVRNGQEKQLAESVLWENCLKQAVEEVQKI